MTNDEEIKKLIELRDNYLKKFNEADKAYKEYTDFVQSNYIGRIFHKRLAPGKKCKIDSIRFPKWFFKFGVVWHKRLNFGSFFCKSNFNDFGDFIRAIISKEIEFDYDNEKTTNIKF